MSVPCPACGTEDHDPECSFCLRAQRIAEFYAAPAPGVTAPAVTEAMLQAAVYRKGTETS